MEEMDEMGCLVLVDRPRGEDKGQKGDQGAIDPYVQGMVVGRHLSSVWNTLHTKGRSSQLPLHA